MKVLQRLLLAAIVLGLLGGVGFFVVRALSESTAEVSSAASPVVFEKSPAVREAVRGAEDPAAPAPLRTGGVQGGAARNERGIELLERGELAEAVAVFEDIVADHPDEEVFRHNLSQALLRLALLWRREAPPCAECVGFLERSLELAPENEDVAKLLERWRREDQATEGFWREGSLHFDLSYDGSRADLLWGAQDILAELERGYNDLGDLFVARPVEEGHPRIQVVLYRRSGFGEITGLGDWAAGAFDGTVRIPVEDLAREKLGLERVLRHELVHVFVRAVGGDSVPGWLNEGLAQWLEGEPTVTVSRARQKLGGVELFSLEELTGSLASWDDAEQIAVAYAQSLALIDHVVRQFGERVLYRMVAACKEGESPAELFRTSVGIRFETVLGDLAGEL